MADIHVERRKRQGKWRKYIKDTDRLEGWEDIMEFMDPFMSRTYFNNHHREALLPYVIMRRSVQKPLGTTHATSRLPNYYSFKQLILLYMVRTEII